MIDTIQTTYDMLFTDAVERAAESGELSNVGVDDYAALAKLRARLRRIINEARRDRPQ